MTINNNISIVTAFFDIGRGQISTTDYPSNLHRSNDTYFDYFAHLATLDNEMVVFTSECFKERILSIRKGKPTTVIIFDFHNRLNTIRHAIKAIQNSPEFIAQINKSEQKNIEYWSADYVLLNNLKTYFVNKAISDKLVYNKQVAWVDFGYVRDKDTLYGLKRWRYSFNDQMNFFAIRPPLSIKSFEKVKHFIFNNEVYVIGGVIVAKQSTWQAFLPVLYGNQKRLLQEGIIDDDQGVYMMCFYTHPKLFCLNPLGDNNWFDVFKRHHTPKDIRLTDKIKHFLTKSNL